MVYKNKGASATKKRRSEGLMVESNYKGERERVQRAEAQANECALIQGRTMACSTKAQERRVKVRRVQIALSRAIETSE